MRATCCNRAIRHHAASANRCGSVPSEYRPRYSPRSFPRALVLQDRIGLSSQCRCGTAFEQVMGRCGLLDVSSSGEFGRRDHQRTRQSRVLRPREAVRLAYKARTVGNTDRSNNRRPALSIECSIKFSRAYRRTAHSDTPTARATPPTVSKIRLMRSYLMHYCVNT